MAAREQGGGPASTRRRLINGLLAVALVSGSVLLAGAVVFLAGRALVRLAPVTLAVVAALLLTALLRPVADALRRWRLPNSVAALAAVLLLLALVVFPFALVGQQVVAQFGDLAGRLSEGLERIRRLLADGPLPIGRDQVDQLWRQAGDWAVSTLPGPASGAVVVAEALGAALLALVLLFFVLRDGPEMWRWLLRLAPVTHRPRVDRAAGAAWDALTGYVRGTLFIAAVDATGIGFALVLLGIPLALPLALLTFIAAFVPIVGATVAGAAAVLVALVANGPTDALFVLAAVIAVQQIEGNVLEPLVMRRAVRLHPAVILVVVASGTVLAGVPGAVVAVPLTAVAYRAVSAWNAYPEGASEPSPAPRERPGADEASGVERDPAETRKSR